MATEVTPKKRQKFFEALREMPNISYAARIAAFSRQTAYRLKESDAEFAAAMQDAIDEGIERLEEQAMLRATKGSDVLLIFLLKAHRPEKYRERVEVGAIDGKPIKVVWDDKESKEE